MLCQHLSEGASTDYTDDGGFTALHVAVAQGSLDCVQLLLQHGADSRRRTFLVRLPNCAAFRILQLPSMTARGSSVT